MIRKELTKDIIDSLITSFKKEKDLLPITPSLLTRFDRSNEEHKACLSYLNGTGGYYMKFLKYLIEELSLVEVVELGNQTGMSTVAIYDAIKKNTAAHFYTIDIEKDQRFCPEEMFTNPQVSFIFGDVCSRTVIKQLPQKIDLLFTDTLHYNYQLVDEFEIYENLLADKALVAIDDIRSNDKGLLFDSLPFSKWDLTELCHESGWGLFLFERKKILTQEQRDEALITSICTVWERKYARLSKVLETHNETLWKRTKEIFKKMKPLYKLYTKTFNKIHAKFFRKKVLFYKR